MNLNEWHFATSVLKQLKVKEKAEFNIIERISTLPDEFVGIVQDSDGINYDIMNPENVDLFNIMCVKHNLGIMDDFQNKKLVLGEHIGDEIPDKVWNGDDI
jgi:hypothetical protein